LSGTRLISAFAAQLQPIAELPNRFTETYGQFDDCLQASDIGGRQLRGMGENQFRVTENAGERIIDVVAEDFGDVIGGGRIGRAQ
jgi:hypothetical protein